MNESEDSLSENYIKPGGDESDALLREKTEDPIDVMFCAPLVINLTAL